MEGFTGKGFKLIRNPVQKEKIFGFSVLAGVGFHQSGKTLLSDEFQLINSIKSDPTLQQILAEQFGPNYKITNSTNNSDGAAKNQFLLRVEAQGNIFKFLALYFALTGGKLNETHFLAIYTPSSGETGTTQHNISVNSNARVVNMEPGIRLLTPSFSGLSFFAGGGYVFQNIRLEKYKLKLMNNEYPLETMSSIINHQYIAVNGGTKIRMTGNIFWIFMGNYAFATKSSTPLNKKFSVFTGLQVTF
ncbi:MAG: hypothetical protein IPH58_15275 [Sphingobacteriales bacterium]|nr:hypothetical protein [Sphingobacteriales bacterium]